MSNLNIKANYITPTFKDIFPTLNDFEQSFFESGLPITFMSEAETLLVIYTLLMSKYANSNILSSDTDQFKLQLFSIIYQHAPNWERRLDLQGKIRSLSDDEILRSSQQIVNQALNPSTAPATDSLEALTYINQQTTSGYKKNKVDAYSYVYTILQDDVTEEFINKFKHLFIKIVYPYYFTIEEEV